MLLMQSAIWDLMSHNIYDIDKFTIIYGNVKSFDLLMRDFYKADQGEDETIPSFATKIEGIPS